MSDREYTLVHAGSGEKICSGWDLVQEIDDALKGERISDIKEETDPPVYQFTYRGRSISFFPSFDEGHLLVPTDGDKLQEKIVPDLVRDVFGSGLEAIPG